MKKEPFLYVQIKGFTLIEMVLSIAMFVLILGMSLPMLRTFTVRNDTDVAVNAIVQNLHRAQILSQIGDGDMTWGVHLLSGSLTVYKGSTFASRDTSQDDVVSISSGITLEGLADIVFNKVTGIPQSTGSIILTSQTGEVRSITINQKGMIDY